MAVERRALPLRQLREAGFIQGFAVLQRGERNVFPVAENGDVVFLGLTLHRRQGLAVTLAEFPVDGGFALLIRGVFEGGGKQGQQAVGQVLDVPLQRPSLARPQPQGQRFARFGEVVEVEPVARRRHLLADRFQIVLHQGKAPRSGFAHHEHVVAGTSHGDAEVERVLGAAMAEKAGKRFQFVRRGEAQRIRRNRGFEIRRGEFQVFGIEGHGDRKSVRGDGARATVDEG